MVYQKTSCHFGFASAAGLNALLFVFLVSFLLPSTVAAVEIDDLFEVEMPILDETKAIRRAALDDGLIEVLIRVSGDSKILEKIAAPASGSYVKRFEYLAQAESATAGAGSQRLWVRYNETRVLDFLRQQAIPIWGKHRSQAVTWLAVRDGGQRYILKDKDVSPIKSKADMAFSRRGISMIWPENDARDQATVYFADVWAGFTDPLKQASQRYVSGPVIVATMAWDGQLWKGDWSLLIDDQVRKWSLSGRDYATLIARAIDLVADGMGQKFAVLETSDISQQKTLVVEIDRVKTVEDFRRIEKYLLSLSAVQSVQLSQLETERVFFELGLRSKVDDLLNQIHSGSVLIRQAEEAVKNSNDKLDDVVATDEAGIMTAATEVNEPVPSIITPYRFILR